VATGFLRIRQKFLDERYNSLTAATLPRINKFHQGICSDAIGQTIAGQARTAPALYNGGLTTRLTVTYSIKEIFYTLQGEGAHAGRPAVFCRFSGCNLWTGRESDRASAVCTFCDTDFVGTDGERGGKFRDAAALAAEIDSLWPPTHAASKYVVFTGGEPLLQLDAALIDAMHRVGFQIAIETNGTLPVPAGVDWICVSPKVGSTLVVGKGNEIKVVIPQANQDLAAYEHLDFEHFFVQPMDGPLGAHNTRLAVETCRRNPKWKLSLQTHKLLQIP
jgi:7-carboxy-7-deazaguanine synthase